MTKTIKTISCITAIALCSLCTAPVYAQNGNGTGHEMMESHSEKHMRLKQDKQYQEQPEMAVIPSDSDKTEAEEAVRKVVEDKKEMAVIPEKNDY